MTSRVPFAAVTAESLSRLDPAERLAFRVAAEMVVRDENPGINTTAALLLTIQRLIADGAESPAAGTVPDDTRRDPPAPVVNAGARPGPSSSPVIAGVLRSQVRAAVTAWAEESNPNTDPADAVLECLAPFIEQVIAAAARERAEVPALPVAAALDREAVREIARMAIGRYWNHDPLGTDDHPAAERVTEAFWPLLEHAQDAVAGSHEGIRLWMLDCGEIVAKHRDRAVAAEAKLAEIDALCRDIRSSVQHGATPIVAVERVLAIIGYEEGADHG